MTSASVATGDTKVCEKVRPREPAPAPTASTKSTPVKSPEKKKSKGDSEKDPMVKDLSGSFENVAGHAAPESLAQTRLTIDLESPVESTWKRTNSEVGSLVHSNPLE